MPPGKAGLNPRCRRKSPGGPSATDPTASYILLAASRRSADLHQPEANLCAPPRIAARTTSSGGADAAKVQHRIEPPLVPSSAAASTSSLRPEAAQTVRFTSHRLCALSQQSRGAVSRPPGSYAGAQPAQPRRWPLPAMFPAPACGLSMPARVPEPAAMTLVVRASARARAASVVVIIVTA